jgi:hypothetical protein
MSDDKIKSPSFSLLKSGNQSLDIEKDFALVFTATIFVDNIARVYISDKNIREEQYLTSLNYYLSNHPRIKRMIFIENSGISLAPFQQLFEKNNPHNKQVEFISLNTNLSYYHKGKGFGECLLIEQGLKKSKLINSVTHFGKITGRLCILNLTEILESLNLDFDCACDYKDQGYKIKKIWNKSSRAFCDTRFIAFSHQFYQQYIGTLHIEFLEKFPNAYFCIEPEFYQKIRSLEKQRNIHKRFKLEPKFAGISGHSGGKKFGGKNYDGATERAKYQLKVFLRNILPGLHL